MIDMNLKTGYCPICDETFRVYSDGIMDSCPYCGHHIMLHEADKDEKE